MKTLPRLLAFLLLVAGWLAFVFEHQNRNKAQHEIDSLRTELAQSKESSAQTLQSEVARRDSEIEKLKLETKEVYKLRSQVNQLARDTTEVEKLRQENQQLKTAAPAVPPPASSYAPQDYISRGDWHFAGYASPESCVQTMLWNMREANFQGLLACLAPEEAERFKGESKNDTEEQRNARCSKEAGDLSGFHIDAKEFAGDEVILTVSVQGKKEVSKLGFKQFNSEWKLTGKK